MNNAVFGEASENVRKHRDIKLVTAVQKRIELMSNPNDHTTKCFREFSSNRNEENKNKNQ